ncbi:MAG: hypothetical protein IAE91_11075 [Ignavibacteriaceae bacterium]|nr:hypothetical protein [Ignavibacteriaceae bacterium]
MPNFENPGTDVSGFYITSKKLVLTVLDRSAPYSILGTGQSFFDFELNLSTHKPLQILEQVQKTFNDLKISMNLDVRGCNFAISPTSFKTLVLPYHSLLDKEELYSQYLWEISMLNPGINPNGITVNFDEIPSSFLYNYPIAYIYFIENKLSEIIKVFAGNNNIKLNKMLPAHRSFDLVKFFGTSHGTGIILSLFYSQKTLSINIFSDSNLIFNSCWYNINIENIPVIIEKSIFLQHSGLLKRDVFKGAVFFADELSPNTATSLEKKIGIRIINSEIPLISSYIDSNKLDDSQNQTNFFLPALGAALSELYYET